MSPKNMWVYESRRPQYDAYETHDAKMTTEAFMRITTAK